MDFLWTKTDYFTLRVHIAVIKTYLITEFIAVCEMKTLYIANKLK